MALVISRADVTLEALQLLETLNSSSSCNKLAATKLVSSCKSIGRNAESTGGSDTYLTLERVRSLYAARLAICELREAGIPTPSACRSVDHFQPPRRGLWGRHPRNSFVTDIDNMPKSDFEPCIRVLESRPQWWTSYSNSKQNAVIICQASRIEIDKEDILETYNSILHSSAKLSDGLHEALRTAAEESTRSRAFLQSTELLRKEMLREMQESTSTLLERMFHNLETRLGLLTEVISSTLHRFRLGLSSLEGVSQSLAIPVRNAEKHNELALSLQSKLKSITKDDITELRQGVENIDSSLEWLYARIVRIYEEEASVSERLRGIESSLAEFQQRADNLDKVQQRQYEIAVAQAQAQQVLEENMRISKGILDQTMSTAANLQAMIGETADTAEAIRHYIPTLPPIKCTDLIYCAFDFLKFQRPCEWLAFSMCHHKRYRARPVRDAKASTGLRIGRVICHPLTGFVTIRARQLQGQAYSLSNLAFPHASSMHRTIACAMRSTAVRYIFG
ncbi:hypothetical protein AN1771.2 [Aspergillus nidulans FGSC A4]|uniref:Tht1-like nuclear fusion protein thtA (Eurofung) n=1 Tax=Emericella nidulans (strain FGSC A4 / ATCC 38163 / CBS 112.46 / NRRL 194 / M139) TaxID=227321 RepID=Q5BCF9_EMENI|nr:hypothetical protein [Aspergillus nidulans FGSC A4]EAA63947.1 hypothetical protein AN1771.2 [Aspergillus nidulans FGSC A4]CBF85530.1 TPA: Tht1-like nuclear fusion protein thtA (Eurofung) [Aspergillus nidulans FGSC A4]|eukprot:XP_659375.1 hypothetical protein AN1771.2 [Aspergillus nidulans FGSC A4]